MARSVRASRWCRCPARSRLRTERRCAASPKTIFDLFEDGAAQEIASFDASATPASIALVIDASPSIFHELAEMRGAARSLAENLSPADEIAVVSFSSEAHLLLPFSKNRALLDRAIESKYLAKVENSSESRIYESVFLAARELFQGRTGRKAIVLLTDGQDSGLGLTWDPRSALPGTGAGASRLAFDDVARELGADGIALFIVSTENRPRGMTPEWLEAHRSEMLVTAEARKQNMPNYTLYLAELARRAGGQLYFPARDWKFERDLPPHRAGDQRAIHARLLSFGGNRAPRLALAARRAGRKEQKFLPAQSSRIAARIMFPRFSRTAASACLAFAFTSNRRRESQDSSTRRASLHRLRNREAPMPAKIEMEKLDASHFRVRVIEAGSESTHQVTLDPKDYARLAGASRETRGTHPGIV